MSSCCLKRKIVRDIEKIYCNNLKIAEDKRLIHQYRKKIEKYLRTIELLEERIVEDLDRINQDRIDIREDAAVGGFDAGYDSEWHQEDIVRLTNNINYYRREIRKNRQYIIELEQAIHNKQREIHRLEDENRCLENQIAKYEDICC